MLRFLQSAHAGEQDATLAGLITRLQQSTQSRTLQVPQPGMMGLRTPAPTPSPTSMVPQQRALEEAMDITSCVEGTGSGGAFRQVHGHEAYGVRRLDGSFSCMLYTNMHNTYSLPGLCPRPVCLRLLYPPRQHLPVNFLSMTLLLLRYTLRGSIRSPCTTRTLVHVHSWQAHRREGGCLLLRNKPETTRSRRMRMRWR